MLLTDHCTEVFGTPSTVAVNCCEWKSWILELCGETVILNFTATEALATLFVSATLVAVMFTEAGVGTFAGAV
jgi:hypothetical protein